MRLKGSELSALALSKTPISGNVRTESGTVAARNAAQTDPDLMQIIETWPSLPASVRAEIVRLVQAQAQARREDHV
jgi:hypothetical protein